MIRKLLLWTMTTSVAATVLLSLPAQAKPVHPAQSYRAGGINDCSSAINMIVVPDGTCYDLSYLTILAKSRSSVAAANSVLKQAAALSASTGAATSYTQEYRGGKSVTQTYQDNPTEGEKAAREQYLNNAAKGYLEASKDNQKVEELAFQIHTSVMRRVSGVLVSPATYSSR